MRHVPQQCTVVICTRVQRPYETAVVINYMHWKTSKRVKRIKKEDPFWIKSKRKLACSQVKLEMECVCTTWMGFISRRNSKQKSNVIIHVWEEGVSVYGGRSAFWVSGQNASILFGKTKNKSICLTVLRCMRLDIMAKKNLCNSLAMENFPPGFAV